MKKTASTASKEHDIIDVGCDDGFASTKLVIYADGQLITKLAIPSRARSGVHGITTIDAPGAEAEAVIVPGYETEGATYTVGNFAGAESARFDNYPFSGMNRVIVTHALRLAGLSGKQIRLATGLPLSTFFKGDKPNEEVIARKDASIRQLVKPLDGSTVAQIVSHRVFPEGLAAWIDYAVDDEGNLRDGVDTETVAVIDIGGRTTDIATIGPGRQIDHVRTGSADIGVLDVIESVRVGILKSTGDEIPVPAIEQALVTRSIRKWGKPVDVGAEIDAATEEVLTRIMREINRRLGTAIDIDKLILVGGGAHVFKKALLAYPNISVDADPAFANARGFAKYMRISNAS